MSYSTYNKLNKKSNIKNLTHLIRMLGYKKIKGSYKIRNCIGYYIFGLKITISNRLPESNYIYFDINFTSQYQHVREFQEVIGTSIIKIKLSN